MVLSEKEDFRQFVLKALEPPKGMDDMTSGSWHHRIADKIMTEMGFDKAELTNTPTQHGDSDLIEALKDIAGYNDEEGNSMMCDDLDECQWRAQKALEARGIVKEVDSED